MSLPAPFGVKTEVPRGTIREEADGTRTVLKRFVFPQKCKANFLETVFYGQVHRPLYMRQQPTVGRKLLQRCLENMGARQFRCFQLTMQATASRKQAAFEELEDDDLDAGFDFLPRSGSDLQQLRWQTKELRKKDSPIFGWPQALRTLSSNGALARKEFDWPLPGCCCPLGRSVLMAQCRRNNLSWTSCAGSLRL